jgi:mannose-1-phosphate guanylyltransferase
MVSIEREVFPELVGNGLICVRSEGYWRDIGTLESFLSANADAVAGRVHTRLGGGDGAVLVDPAADVSADAILIGPVLVAAGAQIGAGAEVGPDAVIGARAVVAPDAVIRGSVLLAGARVSSQSVVERSVVGCDALVGERARVVDSALGTDQAAGAGEELAGERRPS